MGISKNPIVQILLERPDEIKKWNNIASEVFEFQNLTTEEKIKKVST